MGRYRDRVTDHAPGVLAGIAELLGSRQLDPEGNPSLDHCEADVLSVGRLRGWQCPECGGSCVEQVKRGKQIIAVCGTADCNCPVSQFRRV